MRDEKKSVWTPNGGFTGEREERMRLLRANTDLREMKLAKQLARLVSIADVELRRGE
jgi:hypothetical protein